MAATIKDVAERAGCSIATVSRFVNGTAVLTVETRARIEAAIHALGYRPSELGRSLRRQATRTVGVIVPSLTNPVFAASVAGLQARAREAGFGVLIASTEYDPAQEMAALDTLLGQKVEGLALTVSDPLASPVLPVLDAERKPHVLMFNQADRPGRVCVTVDNVAAAFAMTNAILAEGHRRIAFLAGRFSTSDRSRLRYRGFANAMARSGLVPPSPTEVDFLIDMPDQAVAPLFEQEAAPTALFCSNDILALAAIGALQRRGMAVPADVSIVGFDGIALGRMVEPPLATVHQPAREMGETAMEILLAELREHVAERPTFLPFELRLGGTLATAPAHAASSAPLVAQPQWRQT
ncbi:MAG: LacI family DNA-binding transcriptional regulator [Methylobacterium sp.]|jgi:DNA-binding LacI/PurR family transcriptional regulator|nr:LacI family DNA-binding transcriptional regulator [Methylobacterium sp.]MCA3609793.1 LacI family DNA-binding transcriptional regulator [Methylobacterium sp.]MCA3617027.1 LacI family DNA-binding transcriptional regulator [Methylobacterium sp.]MCA3622107.1 LacI family DNA-binding transcriptional regulator [Methylobacterium sp.]MCA3624620.1 LacI family DNA-binding transcriptional regulator [Methylobacterium sp.]